MIARSILVVAAAMTLDACGDRKGSEPLPTSQASAPRATRIGDPAATDAVAAVPSAEREKLGRALACEARRYARRTLRPLIVTPEVVREVAERARRDPRVAECPPPVTQTPPAGDARPGGARTMEKRAD